MKNQTVKKMLAAALTAACILSMPGGAVLRAAELPAVESTAPETVPEDTEEGALPEEGDSKDTTEETLLNEGDSGDMTEETLPGSTAEEEAQPGEVTVPEETEEPMASNGMIDEDGGTAEAVSDDASVSFGVVSDTHVTASKATEQARLKKAFQFYSQSGVDRMVVDGDLTDSGAQSEYDAWKKIKDENLSIPLIASMGNHENNSADRFIAATGNKPNDHKVVNGYHVITVSPGSGTMDEETGKASSHGGGNYTYAVSWLKEQMDEAYADDPDKPIFVFFHHPIKNTFYVSNEWYGSGLDTFFKNYPTAVTFSGHIHSPNNMPTSIWQDGGYTAVNTVTLSYMEMETGMIYGSVPPNASQIAQGLVVEADGSRVTIKNYDFLADKWIPQTWTFDVKDTLPYTEERAAKAEAPYFDEDAKLEVTDISDDSAKLTFTQAEVPENNVGDIVHSYKYEFVNQETGEVDKTFKTWSDYYLQPMPDTISQTAPDLTPGTEYEARIYAIDAYQKMSEECLTAEFKTTGEAEGELTFEDMTAKLPAADMLDVDFRDGKAEDISPAAHSLKGSDGSNLAVNETLGKYTASFTGKSEETFRADWSKEDYDKTNDGFTLETVFKLDKFSGSYVDLIGNMESAGIGLEISKGSSADTANLETWVHVGGSYQRPTAADGLTYGEWVHAAITYDGQRLTLYVNGKKAASTSVSGEVKTPPSASRYFVIGGDSGSNGGVQSPFTGEISTARIYSEPLSAKQIQMIANRDLSLIDKTRPLIQVDGEVKTEGKEGTALIIPAAKAADNSTVVTLKAVLTDQTLNVVKTVGGDSDNTPEDTFLPEAGTYKLTYIAADKAGNERTLAYTISVSAADTGDSGNDGTPGGDAGDSGNSGTPGGDAGDSGNSGTPGGDAGDSGNNGTPGGNTGNGGSTDSKGDGQEGGIKTGDTSSPLPAAVGAAASLAVIAAVVYAKRRNLFQG